MKLYITRLGYGDTDKYIIGILFVIYNLYMYYDSESP